MSSDPDENGLAPAPSKDTSITQEIEYISKSAARGESRVVGWGKLILFATETQDAWMLDYEDGMALCLMKDGARMPVHVHRTRMQFFVEWTHTYEIEGEYMVFTDQQGLARVIHGYPVQEIENILTRLLRATSVFSPPVEPRIGPNQPCPCGSGRKYKKCCGR